MPMHLKLHSGSDYVAFITYRCEFINLSKCELVTVHQLVVSFKFSQ
jgi:hypothetical protein